MTLTKTTANWQALLKEHIDAGDLVEVRIDQPSMSPREVAEWIGVSRTTVSNWIKTGKIACNKKGSHYRIPVIEAIRFRNEYDPPNLEPIDVEYSQKELDEQVKQWKKSHPGYDENNYWDYFRNSNGFVSEDSPGYREADELFSLWMS